MDDQFSPHARSSPGTLRSRIVTTTILMCVLLPASANTADAVTPAAPTGGAVIVAAPTSFADCPSGWVCLWSDGNYSGRLLRWNTPGLRVNLGDYAFNDQMTSWANRSGVDARWFYVENSSGTTRCMNANSSLANVGSADNDKASSLAIYTDAAACS